MDDLGCAVNHVLSWRRWVILWLCNLLFFSLFAFILRILVNLTYVRFAFALFQGKIAACKTCIKFEVRFLNLHLQVLRDSPRYVSSSVPSSTCNLLFYFAYCCFLRFCYENTVSIRRDMNFEKLFGWTVLRLKIPVVLMRRTWLSSCYL